MHANWLALMRKSKPKSLVLEGWKEIARFLGQPTSERSRLSSITQVRFLFIAVSMHTWTQLTNLWRRGPDGGIQDPTGSGTRVVFVYFLLSTEQIMPEPKQVLNVAGSEAFGHMESVQT
jgi:hypothetical protein